jgi:hypothetical protein
MTTRRNLSAALAVLLVALAIPATGMARRLSANTVDPQATISGDHIVATGPLRTTQVEWIDMRVTITQRSTGALAEGKARLLGTGADQRWEVDAQVRGAAAFEEGPAVAVALAITTTQGQPTDAHQWLVPITLHRE